MIVKGSDRADARPFRPAASEADCSVFDSDSDGDVDLNDFKRFLELFSGPEGALDCPTFDSDNDGDIDFADYAAFQVVYTG